MVKDVIDKKVGNVPGNLSGLFRNFSRPPPHKGHRRKATESDMPDMSALSDLPDYVGFFGFCQILSDFVGLVGFLQPILIF